MKKIRLILMKKAYKKGYLDKYDYKKCYFCGSTELTVDKNQNCYHDDIGGSPTFVEGGIVCKKCHCYQGYISYGQVEPCYVKESKMKGGI